MLTTVPSVERRVDALHEADVLVGDEHVDEAAQLTLVVEEALGETGVLRVERLQRVADRRRLDRDLGRAAGEAAQLRGDADRDCHGRQASSMSNAAWNASRLGAIVAVGPLVGATASIVFSP